MKYSISDLANTKGTSEPVRQALIAQAEEIERLNSKIAAMNNELIARDKALDNINAVLKAHQIRPRGKSVAPYVARIAELERRLNRRRRRPS